MISLPGWGPQLPFHKVEGRRQRQKTGLLCFCSITQGMSWAKTCSASVWNPLIPIIILVFKRCYISPKTRCIVLSAIKSSVWGTNPRLVRSLVENMSSQVSKRMIDCNAGRGEAVSRVRHRSRLFHSDSLDQHLFLEMRAGLGAWKHDG